MSEQTELEVLSYSEADTEAVGRAIGLAGRAGDLVGLVGQLGAGKTRLAKGIASGLGVADKRIHGILQRIAFRSVYLLDGFGNCPRLWASSMMTRSINPEIL